MTQEEKRAYNAQYRKNNKEAAAASDARYYRDNKSAVSTRHSEYNKSHKTAKKVYDAQYYKDNLDLRINQSANWRQNNPDLVALYDADRRFKLELATPHWSEVEEIKIVYLKRDEYRKIYGVQFEVDHIIPITSDTVCGLHVLSNLQLLSKSLNSGKTNNYQADW